MWKGLGLICNTESPIVVVLRSVELAVVASVREVRSADFATSGVCWFFIVDLWSQPSIGVISCS